MDAPGLPIRFTITPGHRADRPQARGLIEGPTDAQHVIMDAACDAGHLRAFIADERGATPHIKRNPTRREDRFIDWGLCKERRLVQCFFDRTKRFRRISLPCEKAVSSFGACVDIARAMAWIARTQTQPGVRAYSQDMTKAASQVTAFFGSAGTSGFAISGETVSWTGPSGDWGLRRMVLHYAHLCAVAGGVNAFAFKGLSISVRVAAAICQHVFGRRQAFQQSARADIVAALARAQEHPERAPRRVRHRLQPGVQSVFAASDQAALAPFSAPGRRRSGAPWDGSRRSSACLFRRPDRPVPQGTPDAVPAFRGLAVDLEVQARHGPASWPDAPILPL